MSGTGQNGIDAHDTQGVVNNSQQLGETYRFAAQYIDQNDAVQNEDSADGPTNGSITAADAATDAQNGLKIVSIFETNGLANSPYSLSGGNTDQDIIAYLDTQGAADAEEAVASAKAIDQPAGSAIYFAIDFDPGSPDMNDVVPGAQQAIETYIQAIATDPTFAASGYKIGVYGAGQTLQWVTTNDPANNYNVAADVSYTWLSGSTAWGGYDIDSSDPDGTHGWSMIQTIPGVGNQDSATADGVDVDYDNTANGNFGAWSPEVVCYCRGTRILTPTGEVPVERLQVGDEVMTLSGQARPLTWIGCGRSLVTPANPGARPIVVRQGALADGVPSRDLYLTKGHSLLLDGVLIPVEFLVNDRSIAWDTIARVVEFYHLELERHDVLLAEGAAAESYREDGNRHLFHNTDAPRHASEGMAPYAPVLTGGPEVDRVWARLLARAGGAETELTGDADLHLLADGVRVEGEADGMLHRFRLDRAPFELRIRSRVCNPVRLGIVRDPRDLGVALRRLELRGSGAELLLHYDSPALTDGYNGAEPAEAIRWTTGDGVVPGRVLAAFEGPVEVELLLGMTTRYPCPAAVETENSAQPLRFGVGA